jgi:hypothetical protein
MTEAEARELLRRCDGVGGLEAWIAGRRVSASAPGGGDPAVWVVTR